METPENIDLETFIDQQLKRLPQREAPDNLILNVMAQIAARENRPWWKQPFTSWPRGFQVVLYTFLASGLAGSVYAVSGPAEQVSLSALYERMASVSWIFGRVLEWANQALVMLQGISIHWIALGVSMVLLMYGVCIAGGVALYRIASTHSLKEI